MNLHPRKNRRLKMPETIEGRLELTKLTQKLDDHIATQALDMSELKATTTRIEAKLDIKTDKSETSKIAAEITGKADKSDVNEVATRLWWLIGVLFVAGTGIIVWLIEESIKGRFKI